MLTLLIFLPLLGALLLLRRRETESEAVRVEALLWSILIAVVSIFVYFGYRPGSEGVTYGYEVNWNLFPAFGIHYHLGLDGVSGLLVMLTGILGFVAVFSSFTSITDRVRTYMISLLVLESAMIGVFCALDLFVFYVFWEAMLLPMVFLIGIWGGPRRVYAAVKFFLYTLVGSLLMLVAILFLAYQGTNGWSFDLPDVMAKTLSGPQQFWCFAAFALAFAIKVPLFPFHTWLPDAHVEAPTAGSILLAGVLLKMGTYGFIRIAIPVFPSAALAAAPLFITLGVIGIIYGALVALVQADIKKLVAYSSVAHLGFVIVGLFTFNLIGLQGGMIQQLNHGLSTGALFLLVGFIYERRHTRQISEFGGLWTQMPLYSRLMLITVLASLGLPGLCGFVGEVLVLFGAAQVSYWVAALSGLGVILAALYLLWMFQRVFYGPVEKPENRELTDLNPRELWCIVPLVVLMFLFGLAPTRFLKAAEPTMQAIVDRVEAVRPEQPAADTADSVTSEQ